MWDIHEKYDKTQKPASREEYLKLCDAEFRAGFRAFFYDEFLNNVCLGCGDLPALLDEADCLLGLWRERGLSETDHDFAFAKSLTMAAKDKEAETPLKSVFMAPYVIEKKPVTPEAREAVMRVIHERRSVRAFHDKDIPDELLAKILAAGLNAAHSRNLQSIRFILVNENHEPWVFRGIDIPPGHHHIAVLQDDRCYQASEEKDQMQRIIDAGAATECMLLALHAYGVDGAWLTYNDEEQFPRLREKFAIPVYMRIVDLIELGWGCQTPFPPQRPAVEERVVVRV